MNILNQKICAIRVQIEAERKQQNPNWQRIEELSNELSDCLDQLDVMK